ncbi:hypothetical protein DFS34DRAFT_310027 [Phlyctochytrium arcticum]|nr:hypothetical protein DFS34DRAFT_469881 [Phlyctochytrium arcticum]KAI9092109.1 hypothetical protein DFS34DRAFT_310027 [Phlyctochytrium arcticum]
MRHAGGCARRWLCRAVTWMAVKLGWRGTAMQADRPRRSSKRIPKVASKRRLLAAAPGLSGHCRFSFFFLSSS